MSGLAGITISGAKQLQKKLKKLEAKVQRKVARAALRKGLAPIVKEIRRNAPVGENKLVKKSIGSKVGRTVAKAGVNVGKKHASRVKYGPAVTAGTVLRETASGASRGKVEPNDFVNRAFDKKKNVAAKKIEQALLEGIEKEAKK